jgi:hypothetical protein
VSKAKVKATERRSTWDYERRRSKEMQARRERVAAAAGVATIWDVRAVITDDGVTHVPCHNMQGTVLPDCLRELVLACRRDRDRIVERLRVTGIADVVPVTCVHCLGGRR